MVYIAESVLKEYGKVFGGEDPTGEMANRLAKLGQLHREPVVWKGFELKTGIDLSSGKGLERLIQKLKDDPTCFDEIINNPVYEDIVSRKGPLYIPG